MKKPTHQSGEYRGIERDPNVEFGDVDTFKDARNVMRTKSLFLETYPPYRWEKLHSRPVFTLKDDDYGPFVSLRKLYMEFADRTEYNFAMAIFGSFELWNNICNAKWFEEHITVWRSDLEAKLKSQAFETIKTIATQTESPSTALQAAKFLLKEEWKSEGVTKKVLRKDAEKKQEELKKETIGQGLSTMTEETLDRIMREKRNMN